MYTIINDRIFWIYFIVTFFFIIIGIGSILGSGNPYMIIISILWLLGNVALLILVYHASIKWAPIGINDEYPQICVVDVNSGCFEANNRVWLFINILFLILLIISALWAGELGNADGGPLRKMSGILILLGGLVLLSLNRQSHFKDDESIYNTIYDDIYTIPFWIGILYIVIWFGLTFYVIINTV